MQIKIKSDPRLFIEKGFIRLLLLYRIKLQLSL